jgi:hypothetical protein
MFQPTCDQVAFTLKGLEGAGGAKSLTYEVSRLGYMKHFARRGIGGGGARVSTVMEKHLNAINDRFAAISWPRDCGE